MRGPYHDYARSFFGFARARPGADYARDVLAALPPDADLQGDWGVVPILRHVIRAAGGRVRVAGEGPRTPEERARYLVVSPWNRLPARWGSSAVQPMEELRARGLEVGRIVSR